MAPKTLYNAAEVQQKVTETAEKAFKTFEEEGCYRRPSVVGGTVALPLQD